MNIAALLVPFIVALPPGAAAPPPGALPAAAHVRVLDRQLGLALVELPRRGLAPALRRLRAAPGVRYVERDAPLALRRRRELPAGREGSREELSRAGARRSISAGARPPGCSSASPTPGSTTIAWPPARRRSCTSRRAGMRGRTTRSGTARRWRASWSPTGPTSAWSASCRTRPCSRRASSASDNCSDAVLEDGLVAALGWLRRQGAQVVNISATTRRSTALVDSLRALQLSGALVVAAVGNNGIKPGATFPASQPGVLGVGALAPGSSTQVWKGSTRGSQVDVVAPAEGIKVLATRRLRRPSRLRSPRQGHRSRRRS